MQERIEEILNNNKGPIMEIAICIMIIINILTNCNLTTKW